LDVPRTSKDRPGDAQARRALGTAAVREANRTSASGPTLTQSSERRPSWTWVPAFAHKR